jgi:hypothetical protein
MNNVTLEDMQSSPAGRSQHHHTTQYDYSYSQNFLIHDIASGPIRSTPSETALYAYTCMGVVGCTFSSSIPTRLLCQTTIVPSPFQYIIGVLVGLPRL